MASCARLSLSPRRLQKRNAKKRFSDDWVVDTQSRPKCPKLDRRNSANSERQSKSTQIYQWPGTQDSPNSEPLPKVTQVYWRRTHKVSVERSPALPPEEEQRLSSGTQKVNSGMEKVNPSSLYCTCPPSYNAELSMKSSTKVSMEASNKAFLKDAVQACGSSVNLMAFCSTEEDMKNGNFSMVELADSDYYYNNLKAYIPGLSIEECKNLCLQDCKCLAASHSSADNHCTLKGNTEMGLLMNGYASSGTTLLVKVKVYHPMPISSTCMQP